MISIMAEGLSCLAPKHFISDDQTSGRVDCSGKILLCRRGRHNSSCQTRSGRRSRRKLSSRLRQMTGNLRKSREHRSYYLQLSQAYCPNQFASNVCCTAQMVTIVLCHLRRHSALTRNYGEVIEAVYHSTAIHLPGPLSAHGSGARGGPWTT